ncbi:Hypothetical_protein [Hexamita inflata]|uniref:Hypothetical_protein n=1 Tax=Hexamita inflata TaxID=28002 RepID=A0AA86RFE5_9EUKA|nr:Hypothetical protein HINF_LOCUS59933 [Hexamita inflata]
MSTSDWNPKALLRQSQNKAAIVRKNQDADAKLLKNTPLPIDHKYYQDRLSTNLFNEDTQISCVDNNVKLMSKTGRTSPVVNVNNSLQMSVTNPMENVEENDEYANIDEPELTYLKVKNLQNDNELEYRMEQFCQKYFERIEAKLDTIITEQGAMRKEMEGVKEEAKNQSMGHYKKLNDKLKVLFENQTTLDGIISRIQQTDIKDLQQKMSELAGFINKSVAKNIE